MLRIRNLHYNVNREKEIINYYRIKPKTHETIVCITCKYSCKLCDFYTNHTLLYKRHLNSNNHYNRINQF